VIGGLILPILGALPDVAIIFFSASGTDQKEIQHQLVCSFFFFLVIAFFFWFFVVRIFYVYLCSFDTFFVF
jgi:hypothetical protein